MWVSVSLSPNHEATGYCAKTSIREKQALASVSGIRAVRSTINFTTMKFYSTLAPLILAFPVATPVS
jgi:hypothetical protein